MMFLPAILACLLLAVNAKLNIPHHKTIQIESLVPYDAPEELRKDPSSFAAAVVVDGVSQANQLDMYCNNKFCQMMKYAVSCKAINLGVKKICARYLLGYKYGCDVFPSPPDVLNAPSICIPAAVRMLSAVKFHLPLVLAPYLNATDFSTDTCGRRCYQSYQYATHDFYSTCRPQLNATLNKLAGVMSAFQEFRNQACSESPAGQNCYAAVAGLLPSPSPTPTPPATFLADAGSDAALDGSASEVSDMTEVVGAAAGPDVMNFYCNYSKPTPEANGQVLAGVCQKFLSMGCCAATGITMVQQNQVKALSGISDPTIFPPCLLRYFQKGNCGVPQNVDLQDYCPTGSIASTMVVTGTIFMPKLPVPPPVLPFPNVYLKASVLSLQGAITKILAGFPGFTNWPYLFNPLVPLQVQIIDYTYYDAAFAPLTPPNGAPAYPYGDDYAGASYGNFTYQVVLQDLNATTAQMVYGALSSPQFQAGLNLAFTGAQTNPYVKTKPSMYPAVFAPEPLSLPPKNAAFSLRNGQWVLALLLTVGLTTTLFGGSDRR